MRSNLVLNQDNEIALFYGESLTFVPEWASIDVERGEIFISNSDGTENGRHITLEKIKTEIYERILEDRQILLVEVKDHDISKPVRADWVPLMIAQQM